MQNPEAEIPTNPTTKPITIHLIFLRPQNLLSVEERGEGLRGHEMVKLPTTNFFFSSSSSPPLMLPSSSRSSGISSSSPSFGGSSEDK